MGVISEAHWQFLQPARPGGAFWIKSLSVPGCLSFSTCLGNPDNRGNREDGALDANDPDLPVATAMKC